jgi:hypothetical protein
VAVQLAKTHRPEKCLPRSGIKLKTELSQTSIPINDQLAVPFRRYIFESAGRPLYVYFAVLEDMDLSPAMANPRHETWRRIEAARSGSRNYGQRVLEVAVTGPADEAEAEAALTRQLRSLITVEPPNP